jgi:DNA-directed RNA polymerase subunit K/omega
MEDDFVYDDITTDNEDDTESQDYGEDEEDDDNDSNEDGVEGVEEGADSDEGEDVVYSFGTNGRRRVTNRSRVTWPRLLKYERTACIGKRAVQISKGAPPLVQNMTLGQYTPLQIAQQEIREGKFIMNIERKFPDGSYEEWRGRDLKANLREITPASGPRVV